MDENRISGIVLDRALHIHRGVGSGLLESVYERLLEHELKAAGLRVRRQVEVPLVWKGVRIERAFRADLVVEHRVLVEIKSIDALSPVHRKQVLTYVKLSALKLGLLINFGAPVLKDGFVRLVNGL